MRLVPTVGSSSPIPVRIVLDRAPAVIRRASSVVGAPLVATLLVASGVASGVSGSAATAALVVVTAVVVGARALIVLSLRATPGISYSVSTLQARVSTA